MTTPIPLTLSQLTTANVCPVSPVLSSRMENVTSDKAALGNAVHEALENESIKKAIDMFEGELVQGKIASVAEIARKHGVRESEILDHVANVDVKDGKPELRVELKVPSCGPFVDRDDNVSEGVAGRVDLLEVDGSRAIVTDYKSGTPPHHESDRPIERWTQGWAYGLAVLEADPFLSSVVIRRLWTKTGLEEQAVLDESNHDMIRSWIFNLVTRVCEEWKKFATDQKNAYRVSLTWEGCLSCDALSICPAYMQRAERAMALMGKFPRLFTVTDEDSVREAWLSVEQGTAFARGVKEMKELVGAYLQQNGPVPMSDTTEIRMYQHHTGSEYPRVLKKEG